MDKGVCASYQCTVGFFPVFERLALELKSRYHGIRESSIVLLSNRGGSRVFLLFVTSSPSVLL